MNNQSLKIILIIISSTIFSIKSMHYEIELKNIDLDKKISKNVEQEWGNLQWKEVESNETGSNIKELKSETPSIFVLLEAINSKTLDKINLENIIKYNGNILLHWAMDSEKINSLKILIEKQSDEKIITYFTTQLNHVFLLDAIQKNNLIEVQKYISLVNNINIKDNKGNSLLHKAATIKNGINIVKFLLENGVNIQHKNVNERTAFTIAILHYNSIIAGYLGDQINNNFNYYVKTPREIFKNIQSKPFSSFCNDLYAFISSNKKNLNKKNPSHGNYSLLHWAIYHKNYPVAYYLLDAGANVNTTNWRENSPLDTATEYKNTKMIQLLIDHGAKYYIK